MCKELVSVVQVLKSSGNDEDDVVDFEDDTDNTGGTSTEEEAMGNGKEKADINQSDGLYSILTVSFL